MTPASVAAAPVTAADAAPGVCVKNFEVIRPWMLRDFVERMNRRAKKLGLPPITLEIGKPEVRKQTMHKAHEAGPAHTYGVEVFPVKISVTPIKLPGPWEFAGRIDHEEEGNIIASVPGMDIPARFRTADCSCEHCKTKRTRNHTYVVRNAKEDRHVQVGTDCIRDFLGHDSPEHIAQQLAFFSSITIHIDGFAESDHEFGGGGGSGTGKYLVVEAVLPIACAVIRQHAYVSGGKEREAAITGDNSVVSTRRRVDSVLNNPKADLTGKYAPTDADEALAAESLTWVREELAALTTLSDYYSNLVVAASAEHFNEKHLGLIVSVPSAYEREVGKRRELARKATTSRHVGAEGERVDFDLVLRKTRTNPSDFGVSTLCEFEDADGNIIKWWKSGPDAPCELDQRILLKGTIKGHGHYKGVPETTINRCKPIAEIKKRPGVAVPSAVADGEEISLAAGCALAAPVIDAPPVGPTRSASADPEI